MFSSDFTKIKLKPRMFGLRSGFFWNKVFSRIFLFPRINGNTGSPTGLLFERERRISLLNSWMCKGYHLKMIIQVVIRMAICLCLHATYMRVYICVKSVCVCIASLLFRGDLLLDLQDVLFILCLPQLQLFFHMLHLHLKYLVLLMHWPKLVLSRL